jgi:hypothetical protein
VRPHSWKVLLGVLLVALTAGGRSVAAGRESRWGTVLLAGGEAPPVLYVAAGTASLVRFEDLEEPRAVPGAALGERLEVAALGERALVVSPVRELAAGERLLLKVTGRTAEGSSVTVTLALRSGEVVDVEARVIRGPRAERGEAGAVARMLLGSHEREGAAPRLGLLVRPEGARATDYTGYVSAEVESVLRVGRQLFVTVVVYSDMGAAPWMLVRVRLEPRCAGDRVDAQGVSLRVTSSVHQQRQLHVVSALVPEGAECVALTLEEDGPRALRFAAVRLPP